MMMSFADLVRNQTQLRPKTLLMTNEDRYQQFFIEAADGLVYFYKNQLGK